MDAVRVETPPDVLAQTASVVAAQREFAQRLSLRTMPDPLTGQPVRSLLVDRLELSLAVAGPSTGRLAVLCCDLDGVAVLEHGHGPTVVAAARTEASARLVGAVRQGDLVARVGTQTFVLLCPGIQLPSDAQTIVTRVQDAFDLPLRPAADLFAPVRISVGAALSGPTSTPATLLSAADQAMTDARLERQGAGRQT